MSTRIYKVTTPRGNRLVEASTKSQAINHCVSTDYSAEPIASSELYAAISQGAIVEKVTPAKKSEAGDTTQPPASNPPAASTPPQLSVAPQASTAPQAPTGETPLRQDTEAPAPQSVAPVPVATVATAPAVPAAEPALPAFLKKQPVDTQAAAEAKAWTPPPAATAPAVHPVLAEQQRINPQAATAAGAPPRPIIQPAAVAPEGGAQ